MTTRPKILVFDSGVGGLSIIEAIKKQHPHCTMIYASDNAAFPYGSKPEQDLIIRVNKVVDALQQRVKVDIIVVACNTASTVTLPSLRARFDTPIIGVVPAIKPAAKLSSSKVIGLIATPGTIARAYTASLIQEHARECTIVPLGSEQLVLMAEAVLRKGERLSEPTFLKELNKVLDTLTKETTMDTAVLACTHFPLLKPALAQVLPQVKHWVDSGHAIARRVGYWLEQLDLQDQNREYQDWVEHQSLFTAMDSAIESLRPALLQFQLNQVDYLELP